MNILNSIHEDIIISEKLRPIININIGESVISQPLHELAKYTDKQLETRTDILGHFIHYTFNQACLDFDNACADKLKKVVKYRNMQKLKKHYIEQQHVKANSEKIKMRLVDRLPFELLLEIMGFAGDRAYIKLFIGRYSEMDAKGVSGMMRLFSQINMPRLKSFIPLTLKCYNSLNIRALRAMNKRDLIQAFIGFLTNTENTYTDKRVIIGGNIKDRYYYNIADYEAAALYLWRVILLAAAVGKKKTVDKALRRAQAKALTQVPALENMLIS